jgi:GNAT superfamily N-acetyltransferase
MVEFRELSTSHESDVRLLGRFYAECFTPAFPDPDERESLENFEIYLQVKQRGMFGANNYHVIVATDGDIPIAGSIAAYMAEPNAGAIEYLLVNPDRRGGGLATRMLKFTEAALDADARRNGQPIALIIAEIDDPFRTPRSPGSFNPFNRASIWHNWGFRMLNFPYLQRALTPDQSAMDSLMLIAKNFSPEFAESISAPQLQTLLHEYLRWAMQIHTPHNEPAFTQMSAYLAASDKAVALSSLSAYIGGDDSTAPVRVHEITGHTGAEALEAPLPLNGMADEPNHHLWSIHRSEATAGEGIASFLAMPDAGYGYLRLSPPLHDAGRLQSLCSRMERQLLDDGTTAQGWYVQCEGGGERDILVRPEVGFHELDVCYIQPGADAAADRPAHLLYKPFGRVYHPPELPVADFLTSIRQLLAMAYETDDPRFRRVYSRLEGRVAGRRTVPFMPGVGDEALSENRAGWPDSGTSALPTN